MLTVATTRRSMRFWALVLTLTGIVAGILIWQLPQNNTATAQATWEDICEDLDVTVLPTPAYMAYDSSERSTFTREYDETVTTTVTRTETQVTTHPYYGRHEIEYAEDRTPISEYFLVVRPDEETDSRARNTENETYSVTSYHRSTDDQGAWEDWDIQSEPIERAPEPGNTARNVANSTFCGTDVDEQFTSFRYIGEETIDGVETKHFVGIEDPLGDADADFIKHEFWISLVAFPVQYKVEHVMELEEYWTDTLVAVITYSDFGEQNVINPPGQAAVLVPTPGSTPAVEPTAEATQEPTLEPTVEPTAEAIQEPTLEPTAEATQEPTQEPTAEPTTPAIDVWLEPDPETITFDGHWRQFTVRGAGLDRVHFSTNVINYPDGPSSTGAVELSSRRSPPSASDACETTYFSGYAKNVGDTFHMVGCQAGTVILRLADPSDGYTVLREYTVAVSGGP